MRTVHGWRRALRWALGIFGGLLGFVGLVIIGAYIAFSTSWGHSFLRNQIASSMNDAFVGGATVGGVEGNPFKELVLTDVVINGPDHQPAIKVKRLTVKLPLLPLISHQLRVDRVIVDDLDVALKRDANGELEISHLTKPGPKSTWSIKLPNVEVHRGHIAYDTGTEVMNFDNLELGVDAALPFAGPISANANITGSWRERKAPINIAASVYGDNDAFEIRSLGAQVGGVTANVLAARIPTGPFAKPFSGTITVIAPAAAVHQLVPTVTLPGDAAFAVHMTSSGRLTYATIAGSLGDAELRGSIRADVQAKIASGFISAAGLDLDALTTGKMTGHGAGLISFDVNASHMVKDQLPPAHAVATLWGNVKDMPPTTATIALVTAGDRIDATVGATNDGIRAGVGATITRRGKEMLLDAGRLVASTSNPSAAAGKKLPVRGALTANLSASGRISPNMDLAVAGTADGKNLRMNDIGVSRLALHVDAKHIPDKPVGSARVELDNAHKGNIEFSKLTLAAGNRPDGKLQVTVRSRPQPAPWAVDLDALVAMGDTIVIDLQRHFVRAGGASEWHGHTGEISIGPRTIEIKGLKTETTGGSVAIDGSFVRAGRNAGDFKAKVDGALDLTSLKKAYSGHVDAHIDVERTKKQITGVITAKAGGIALAPQSPLLFDGNVKIEASSKQLLANIDVSTAKAGSAKIALDVDAPKDITNLAAWRQLGRSSIDNLEIKLDAIDLSQIAKAAKLQPMAGRIDGDIKLTEGDASGSVAIRGVKGQQMRDIGSLDADLKITQLPANEIETTFTAKLSPTDMTAKDLTQNGAARLSAEARFGAPEKLFDPAAWKKLGANTFRGAKVQLARLGFEPGTLERFGVITQLRGELAAGAEIDEGMKAVRFNVSVSHLRGGLFAQPITTNVVGEIDDQSSRGVVTIISDRDNVALVRVTGKLPVTLEQLRADPKAAKTAPLDIVARIDNVPAVSLMNVIGTSQITSGALDGTIKVAGTVARPTVDAKIVATNVSVPAEEGKPTQSIQKLTIAANFDGKAGKLAIDGKSSGNGTLAVRAAGDLDHPEQLTASLDAARLDIAPLVAFMPGPAGGLGGRLDANFKLKGADPRTADISGKLHIVEGRIPIAPSVGTMFKGDLHVDVANHVVDVNMTGKLGRGDVKLKANAPLDGATPRSGKLELTIDKVQLIGTTEPILTGFITADLARVNERWRAAVRVEHMTVKVPAEKGDKLAPVGAPQDLVYGGLKVHHGEHHGHDVPAGIVHDSTGPADFKPSSQVADGGHGQPTRKLPDEPVMTADITIRNTFVESKEMRGIVGGHLAITLGANKEVGLVGHVNVSRGVLELFDRRYLVERAGLHFDGSVDPVLDIRITHDFPEVTTITEVHGRMSKPELQLSSQPGQYSQAELLGFLLGGEPGGDPENAPSATQRVESAGASFIANQIGGYVKKALPIDVDVLRYEAASSTSSAAVTVGTWLTDVLFLAYRQHLAARPDENTGEGEIEYWIQRRLVVEGVVGDRGVNGVDLLWRRRW